MDALAQTLIQEIPETVTTTLLLEYVPRFLQEAQALTVPGAEKKEAVLKALATLVDLLKDAGKVSGELEVELKAFVAVTVAPTIDLMIAAYKGTLTPTTTTVEITQKVNCFLQIIRIIFAIVKVTKVKKAKVVAETTKTEEAEVKDAEVKPAEVTPEVEQA